MNSMNHHQVARAGVIWHHPASSGIRWQEQANKMVSHDRAKGRLVRFHSWRQRSFQADPADLAGAELVEKQTRKSP